MNNIPITKPKSMGVIKTVIFLASILLLDNVKLPVIRNMLI